MKLEVYIKEPPEETEQTIRLAFCERLCEEGDEIFIVAVRKHGGVEMQGNLIAFLPNGRIRLGGSVNPDLGFDLDEKGRIKLAEEVQ